MIDYSTQLVQALSTVLPTHYELICDSSTKKPCITYQEYNNYDDVGWDKTRYSYIEYMVKIWSTDISVIMSKAVEIDNVLKPLGFERLSSNELIIDNQICKMLIYRCHGIEY